MNFLQDVVMADSPEQQHQRYIGEIEAARPQGNFLEQVSRLLPPYLNATGGQPVVSGTIDVGPTGAMKLVGRTPKALRGLHGRSFASADDALSYLEKTRGAARTYPSLQNYKAVGRAFMPAPVKNHIKHWGARHGIPTAGEVSGALDDAYDMGLSLSDAYQRLMEIFR